MKTETEIKKEINDFCKFHGFKHYRMQAGRVRYNVHTNPPGTPDDFYVGKQGFSFWCEVKTENGKLSPVQEAEISTLRLRGQKVCVARSVQDIIKFLRQQNKPVEVNDKTGTIKEIS